MSARPPRTNELRRIDTCISTPSAIRQSGSSRHIGRRLGITWAARQILMEFPCMEWDETERLSCRPVVATADDF